MISVADIRNSIDTELSDEEIQTQLNRMDMAAREDRDRFFKVADSMQFQPKWQDRLSEIEAIKQQWRDVTSLSTYPNIDFPPVLPVWFPKVNFFSKWAAGDLTK